MRITCMLLVGLIIFTVKIVQADNNAYVAKLKEKRDQQIQRQRYVFGNIQDRISRIKAIIEELQLIQKHDLADTIFENRRTRR